jgi:hypothetical protein
MPTDSESCDYPQCIEVNLGNGLSATPTGFAVTDLNTHTILMQIATPAPVTGIAVDTSLQIAYVTVPDANELLTVPLPN